MFKQKKKATRPMQASSVIESLEGRRMFSASAGAGGEALLADGNEATSSFSFVIRVNKSSPSMSAAKITFTDILVSS